MMLLRILYLGILLNVLLFSQSSFAQNPQEVSLNGHFGFDIYNYSQSNGRRVNGALIEVNPSILIQKKPTIEATKKSSFGIGVRTHFQMIWKDSEDWEYLNLHIGIYPFARFYLKTQTFLEFSAGSSLAFWRNITKSPRNVQYSPIGKQLIWKTHLAIGQELFLSERVSFDPLVGYQFHTAGLFEFSQPEEIVGDKQAGLIVLIGFRYRINE